MSQSPKASATEPADEHVPSCIDMAGALFTSIVTCRPPLWPPVWPPLSSLPLPGYSGAAGHVLGGYSAGRPDETLGGAGGAPLAECASAEELPAVRVLTAAQRGALSDSVELLRSKTGCWRNLDNPRCAPMRPDAP